MFVVAVCVVVLNVPVVDVCLCVHGCVLSFGFISVLLFGFGCLFFGVVALLLCLCVSCSVCCVLVLWSVVFAVCLLFVFFVVFCGLVVFPWVQKYRL